MVTPAVTAAVIVGNPKPCTGLLNLFLDQFATATGLQGLYKLDSRYAAADDDTLEKWTKQWGPTVLAAVRKSA